MALDDALEDVKLGLDLPGRIEGDAFEKADLAGGARLVSLSSSEDVGEFDAVAGFGLGVVEQVGGWICARKMGGSAVGARRRTAA
jgi:hypothetical protein